MTEKKTPTTELIDPIKGPLLPEPIEPVEPVTTEIPPVEPIEPVEPPKELTKEEKKKAAAEAKAKETEVDPADVQKYEYLTRLLNINTDMTPAEVIRYDQIIQHTGFTPDLLLEIIKDPKCERNQLVWKDKKVSLMIEWEDLLIISKALSKKISKEVNSYTERDREPKTFALINKYWINLTDLKGWVKMIAEKVIDPKTGKVDKESIDLIVKWFEQICLK